MSIEKIINHKIIRLEKKYNIKINKNIKNEIKELSDYYEFGARKIDKIIKDKLENQIIDNLIENKRINIRTLKEKSIV